MANFHFQLVSPQQVEFEGEVSSVNAPGGLGYLGILANHAPLLSTLTDGRLRFIEANGAGRVFQVSGGGFIEVHNNKVTVLARRVQRS